MTSGYSLVTSCDLLVTRQRKNLYIPTYVRMSLSSDLAGLGMDPIAGGKSGYINIICS